MVRVRPSTLVGQPPPLLGQVAVALPRRSGRVSDQGSWSDSTIFHNTLVVGSSPTSSTTQSPTTGESGLVKNVIVESRPGCRDSRRAYYAACSPRRLAPAHCPPCVRSSLGELSNLPLVNCSSSKAV